MVGSGYVIFLLVAAILIAISSVFLWRASLDRPKFIDRMLTHAMIGLALWALALAIAKYGLMMTHMDLMEPGLVVDSTNLETDKAIAATKEMLAHLLLFLATSLAAFISIVAQIRRRRASITEPK